MTAEVAIINSNGVALAADSAVTVRGKKIFNSALKLFSLSKTEPVGIMVYGTAELLAVPWETLIKLNRKSINGKKYPKLEDYCDQFINYLKTHTQYFSEQRQEEWLLMQIIDLYNDIVVFLQEMIQEEALHGTVMEEDKRDNLIKTRIDFYHDYLMPGRPRTLDISKSEEKSLRLKVKELVKKQELIDYFFKDFNLNSVYTKKLESLAIYCVTHHTFQSSNSGIVIAGFGEEEIYPSVFTYEIAGMFNNKLIYRKVEGKCMHESANSPVGIIAFAQEDMVATLMNGINPNYDRFVNEIVQNSFDEIKKLVKDRIIENPECSVTVSSGDFDQVIDQITQGIRENVNNHRWLEHVDPVVSMVGALPKDELAAMAESLVNLTAFKRRITESLETVGGPIDVAVISKGDGFVWVKRKHYFPAELNQHFIANYLKDNNDAKD
ncbi:hypothetical protein V8P49_01885 [Acinetobacter baumannii]